MDFLGKRLLFAFNGTIFFFLNRTIADVGFMTDHHKTVQLRCSYSQKPENVTRFMLRGCAQLVRKRRSSMFLAIYSQNMLAGCQIFQTLCWLHSKSP